MYLFSLVRQRRQRESSGTNAHKIEIYQCYARHSGISSHTVRERGFKILEIIMR